ncbi:hypothetical protein A3K63_03650 [Candidatus Micrarchaeota archaeon RBG_16_49_10]|nr:MAG: hypothetical protein A3K63_03650 [Candidatus Micrarchaeota archaeon RBG_16_49_10]
MSIFGIFKRKRRKPVSDADLNRLATSAKPLDAAMRERSARDNLAGSEPLPRRVETTASDTSRIEMDNVRAKLDLILTDLSSIKVQNQNVLERLKALEEASKPSQKAIRYY